MKLVKIDDPCLDILLRESSDKLFKLFQGQKNCYKVDELREFKLQMTYSSIGRAVR